MNGTRKRVQVVLVIVGTVMWAVMVPYVTERGMRARMADYERRLLEVEKVVHAPEMAGLRDK